MDKRRVAKETFSKIGGAFAADLVPCQVEPGDSSVDLQNVSCCIPQISASQLFICVSMRAKYRMCGLVGCCKTKVLTQFAHWCILESTAREIERSHTLR